MFTGPKQGLAVLTLAAMPLAGCIVQQPPVAPQPIPANATRLVEKTAIGGQTIRVDFAYQMNPDCTVRGIPSIVINQQPMHGTTKISDIDDFPSYPAQNSRSVCNKTRASGVALEYTPTNGYAGSDFLSYDAIFNDGVDRHVNVAMTVK